MSNQEIIKVLTDNSDLFEQNNIFSGFFRWLGWSLITFFRWIAKACKEIYNDSFGMVDFNNIGPVREFIDTWKPVLLVVLCLSILAIGIMLVVSKKQPKILTNILLFLMIVSGSTYVFSAVNSLTRQLKEAALDENTTDIVDDIIRTNTFDLKYIDSQVGLFSLKVDKEGKQNRVVYPELSEYDYKSIKINEVISPKDSSLQNNSKLIVGKIVNKVYGTDPILVDIKDGILWTDLMNEYYYRYQFNWPEIIIGLVTMALVYICISYKVFRLSWEIANSRILAYLYSANLTNGQKTLKIIDGIKDAYIVLIFTTILIKIYTLAYTYITTTKNFGRITSLLFLIFLAFATIDGPNIVEKITGIDAGLRSSVGRVLAAAHIGKGIAHAATHNPVSKAVGSAVGATAGAAAVGAAAGIGQKISSYAQEKQQQIQQSNDAYLGSMGGNQSSKNKPDGDNSNLGGNLNDSQVKDNLDPHNPGVDGEAYGNDAGTSGQIGENDNNSSNNIASNIEPEGMTEMNAAEQMPITAENGNKVQDTGTQTEQNDPFIVGESQDDTKQSGDKRRDQMSQFNPNGKKLEQSPFQKMQAMNQALQSNQGNPYRMNQTPPSVKNIQYEGTLSNPLKTHPQNVNTSEKNVIQTNSTKMSKRTLVNTQDANMKTGMNKASLNNKKMK